MRPVKEKQPQVPLARMALRSLTLQGSWNYLTMLGGGFAFAILPALLRLHGHDPAALQSALRRHSEHFNAHPYLSGVALGAVARMEASRVDPEHIRRFKTAVRGPLGGLGDTLVWAGGLPALLLVALALVRLGAPAWVAIVVFLGCYNAGHAALRIWGFRVGFRSGAAVGSHLRQVDLPAWGGRFQAAAVTLLGAVLVALFVAEGPLSTVAPWWVVPAGALFVTGALRGRELWRPAGVAFAFAIAGLFALGAVS